MRLLRLAASFPFLCSLAWAGEPNPPYVENELRHLPTLSTELHDHWPGVAPRAHFAAQVRQETCPGVKSPKCWNPQTELKTSREYGFGLGQVTITNRFNNFEEARKLHPSMKSWEWDNRYNAEFQLRTLVLTDRSNYNGFSWAADHTERLAFAFAGYNGGVGGVLSDRAICRATPGCDDTRWFGHIENTSKKSKVAAGGYGQSFFAINRGYVRHIMVDFPPRYRPFFGE